MTAPSVDVHIAAHGRTALLQVALTSALIQDYPGEVVVHVYNDCPRQLLECRHSRVRMLNGNKPHPTIGDKRAWMLNPCRADWVAWLDDDDAWAPWRLMSVLAAAKAGADAVFDDTWHVLLDDGSVVVQPCPGGIAFAARTQALRDLGGFDRTLDHGEDNDLRRRFLDAGRPIHRHAEPGYVYRKHREGVSRVGGSAAYQAATNERILAGVEPAGVVAIHPRVLDDAFAHILGSVLYARRARRGLA